MPARWYGCFVRIAGERSIRRKPWLVLEARCCEAAAVRACRIARRSTDTDIDAAPQRVVMHVRVAAICARGQTKPPRATLARRGAAVLPPAATAAPRPAVKPGKGHGGAARGAGGGGGARAGIAQHSKQ